MSGKLQVAWAKAGAKLEALFSSLGHSRAGRVIMGNGAKIGLVGVLALIVLVVAVWDKSNEEGKKEDLKALPIVQQPPRAGPRVKPLPEPAREDRVVGQIDHNGSLAVGVPNPPARVEPLPAVAHAPPAPSQAAPPAKKYTILAHDTLSSIAAAHYGNRGKWKVIWDANRDAIPDSNHLPVGREITIPQAAPPAAPVAAAQPPTPRPGSEPRAAAPVPAGARKTHVVKRGETLSIIAEQELGSRAKWRAIFEANKDKLPSENSLKEGQELVIP